MIRGLTEIRIVMRDFSMVGCVKGFVEPEVRVVGGRAGRFPISSGSAAGFGFDSSQVIGRDEELGRISSVAEPAIAGRGGIVMLKGEPGIGKTAMLTVISRALAERGMRVCHGSARELEQAVGFAAIGACLGLERPSSEPMLERARTILFGQIGSAMPQSGHDYAVVETLLSLIDTWCSTGPVAVILDDAQWADPASLMTLQRLGEMAFDLPLFVMVATRQWSAGHPLAAFWPRLEAKGAVTVRLGALSEAAVSTLVERTLGARADPSLMATVARADGNPLCVEVLMSGLLEDGAIAVVDGVAEPSRQMSAARLPKSVTDEIRRRLDSLLVGDRHLLSMAAALGASVEVVELSSILGESVITIWSAIAAAIEVGLLIRDDERIAFRHDVFQQAIADRLPVSSQDSLRRRAAITLMSMEAPVERVAAYLSAGPGPIEPRGIVWLAESVDALLVRAPETAIGLLERVVNTGGIDTSTSQRLELGYVRALLRSGRLVDAESFARQVLAQDRAEADEPTAVHLGLLRWLLAQACFAQGRMDATAEVAEATLARPGMTPEAKGRYHGFLALTYLSGERYDDVEQFGQLAVSVGDSYDDLIATGMGCTALSGLRYAKGYLDDALVFSDRVLAAAARQGGGAADQFDVHLIRGNILIELDRLDEADGTFTAAARDRELVSHMRPAHQFSRARTRFVAGEWDDAIAEMATLQDFSDSYGYAAPMQNLRALIALRRGSAVPDLAVHDESDRRFGNRTYLHLGAWVRAVTSEGQGRPDEALQILAEAVHQYADTLCSATLYYIYPDLARLAAMGRDPLIAEQVAVASEELARRQPTASRRATAALCRGLLAGRSDLLGAAFEAFQAAGRPWYAAQALESLAAQLVHDGQGSEANRTLDRALGLYADLGCEWDIARAETRLRGLGLRRGRGGRRNRPKHGMAALTVTERKVAELVAQGCSNSDIAESMFLSRRTVETHVSSILAKLGLNSRVLVAIAFSADSRN